MTLVSDTPMLQEWDFERNDISPYTVKSGSGKKVYWKCVNGHSWQAIIANRTRRGSSCPLCKQTKRLIDCHLPFQWSENNDFGPEGLAAQSNKKAEWVCPKGHYWTTQINLVTSGSGCPYCSGHRSIPFVTDVGTLNPELREQWSEKNEDIEKFGVGSHQKVWWKCSEGHQWQAFVYNRSRAGCPECSRSGRSQEEQRVADLFSGLNVLTNDRNTIAPKELDIYIPSKHLAIEYNGLYWHTEKEKGRSYHYDKWLACKERGIQLITIWEDDWLERQPVVQKMLRSKVFGRRSIGARNTKVKGITFAEASGFLTNNHIQGPCKGSVYVGLFQKSLLAVAVLTYTATGARLDRYASGISITGGLDKILKSLNQNSYYTFADHCHSNGNLYTLSGWKVDKELPPDYSYLVNNRRVHKFNYRLEKFRSDKNLLYIDGASESQLAQANKLQRIYDCGKTRYIKSYA